MSRWLPEPDAVMRLRMKRLHMALGSYLMFLLPIGYAVWHGWTDFTYPGLALYLFSGLLINIVFQLAVRSGFSLRFRDPSLTAPQILVAAAYALVMIHFAGEARSVLLMLFFTSFFFGMFALSTRQMLALTAAIASGYALLIVVPVWRAGGSGSEPFRVEVLRLMTLTMVLVWLSLIGGYVGRLRHRLATALERLRALASHDELTGVYNRRHLMEILLREKERADRYGHNFSVCILDLDHFKNINDSHGHQAGDDVLRTFAQRMREHSRVMDWVAREDNEPGAFGRFGGEEFLLVLPHACIEGARVCVERIWRAMQSRPINTCAGSLSVTFSAGVAEYRQGEPVQDTLNRADAALYRAKAQGRNRIETETGTAEAGQAAG